jgi:hypothetical protein
MLIITIGYGEEQRTYRLCKAVWDLHVLTASVPDVCVFFVQTKKNQSEEFIVNGNELTIRDDFSLLHTNLYSSKEGLVASDWSANENNRQVYRQKKIYSWIKQTYGESCNFWFGTTITSLHSMSVLSQVVKHLPDKNIYAGYPCMFPGKFLNFSNFVFISGSNSLLSYDLVKLLIDDENVDYLGLPNDVWIGVRLAQSQRMVLPRYDIESDSQELYTDLFSGNPYIISQIRKAIKSGHFHFRVKSSGNRELVDHLVLLEVYKMFAGMCLPRLSDLISLSNNRNVA